MGRRGLTKTEMDYRLKRLHLLAPWYGRALVTLATAVPAGITVWLLQAFSGKTTDLKINVVVGVSLTANLVMSTGIWRQRRAMDAQTKEIERLRGRLEEREADTLGTTPKTKGKRQ
jgi:hypothetical protein